MEHRSEGTSMTTKAVVNTATVVELLSRLNERIKDVPEWLQNDQPQLTRFLAAKDNDIAETEKLVRSYAVSNA
jgi:hypothetical protein